LIHAEISPHHAVGEQCYLLGHETTPQTMSNDGYKENIKAYFAFRFVFFIFGTVLGILLGVSFIVYWVCHELFLESSYKKQYGADWQIEFEKYHGALSQAHTQIAICISSILAVAVIITWFLWYKFYRHKHRRHDDVV
jgi:hypothetical protein